MNEKRRLYKGNVDEVFDKLVDIADAEFGSLDVDKINKRIYAVTTPSLLSYGEKIEILANEYSGGTSVLVRASPRVWFNVSTGGRTNRQIRSIHSQLEDEFEGEDIE